MCIIRYKLSTLTTGTKLPYNVLQILCISTMMATQLQYTGCIIIYQQGFDADGNGNFTLSLMTFI